MIEFGPGMIFPDYDIETVSCPECGEDRWPDEPCEPCRHEWPEDDR